MKWGLEDGDHTFVDVGGEPKESIGQIDVKEGGGEGGT